MSHLCLFEAMFAGLEKNIASFWIGFELTTFGLMDPHSNNCTK